jgi:potassium-dependent mechanosensitive channel
MKYRHKPSRTLALMLVLSIGCASAAAPVPASNAADASSSRTAGLDPTLKSALTPRFLKEKIKETESATDIDDAAKARLTEQYRKTLSSLEAARALDAKATAYKEALEKAPREAQAIREKLGAATQTAAETGPPDGAKVSEIEQRLAKTQADATAVATKLSEIEKELEDSTTRPTEARQAIGEVKQELDDVESEIQLPPPQGEPSRLTDARRWALIARRQALRSQVLMLDQELLSQGARVDLLKALSDKATSDLKRLKETEQRLQAWLNDKLVEKAANAAVETTEAERRVADQHVLVQDLARRNAELSQELTAMTTELDRLSGSQEKIEEQARQVGEDFRSARQRLEAAGLTQALGQVLFDQRKQLPDLRSYRKAASEREDAIAEATLRQIRYAEELRELRDPDAYVAELMTGPIPAKERVDVQEELRKLAEQRKILLDQASEADESYLRELGDLDYASSRLIEVVDDYDDFLSERLLWVRSARPVSLETLKNLPVAVLWAIDPANWLQVMRVLAHEAAHSILFWVLLLTVAALEWKARAMRRRIRASAEHLRRIRTDKIGHTLEALVLSLLVAAPLSLLLATLGWSLSASLEQTGFTRAIGHGAISVSLGLYYLRAFRVLCMPGGVADRHFRWSAAVLTKLRRNFDWLLAVLVPLGFVASATYSQEDVTYSGSLGRLSLIALTIGLAIFFWRVLDPEHGAVAGFLTAHPGGLPHRLRRLWYPLVVGTPLALAILTIVGYQYATSILLGSLVSTMYLVLALTVLHQLILRWLVLVRRRLALRAALERRAARGAQQENPAEPSTAGAAVALAAEAPDLESLDEQTRTLINALLSIGGAVVLWLIWSPVLPALGLFRDIALWHHMGIVNGEERMVPVSLADMGLILIIALLAIVAAKNVPALLEILLLSRTRVSSGSRYAVKTLTGYGIFAITALMIFGTLGLSWGQVQWLVAALGVGIGIGLQEIVANFISGIIILFERPIRVGDVVTIGDTTGSVSRIRIRATTIRNWDKQELLVPNKEFITGRLLNWTLTDNLNRIVITVGVDYGADVPRALALLEEAAEENPQVLDDPAPLITFEGFGDSALTLVLRCYLESVENRLARISELHQSINEKFRRAGISIAFPQRDVHLTTGQPLDVRVHRAWPEAAEPPSQDAKGSGPSTRGGG